MRGRCTVRSTHRTVNPVRCMQLCGSLRQNVSVHLHWPIASIHNVAPLSVCRDIRCVLCTLCHSGWGRRMLMLLLKSAHFSSAASSFLTPSYVFNLRLCSNKSMLILLSQKLLPLPQYRFATFDRIEWTKCSNNPALKWINKFQRYRLIYAVRAVELLLNLFVVKAGEMSLFHLHWTVCTCLLLCAGAQRTGRNGSPYVTRIWIWIYDRSNRVFLLFRWEFGQ